MRIRSALVPAIAAAVLLVTPWGAASAASPEEGTIVNVDLKLPASNGMRALLETSDKGMVTLELQRGREHYVSYEVAGKVTEAGLRVRFGRLGLIDVAFTPTRTLSSTAPSEGCTGAPRTLREGTFSGTIDFTGERGYVRIDPPQATGSMSVVSQWQCPQSAPFMPTAEPLALRSHDEEKSASFHAFGRSCGCYFSAGVHRGKLRARSVFVGVKFEQREGMEIIRALSARAGGSAFVYDLAAGTATVRPPRPFRGQSTLVRRPGERTRWRSTLRMAFLGAAPIAVRGADFALGLQPGYLFD
ncbi:MAG TPA: hypothetical protein VFX85_08820 [Solirubrobacterales bacterium]|nr:hypothetical protein [Solirubrobacterales bacterium]